MDRKIHALLMVSALALPMAAGSAAAQQATPAQQTTEQVPGVVEAAPGEAVPYVLRPFSGNYQVFRDQKPLGNATMRLVNTGGSRWRIDLNIVGTQGIAGAAGVNIQQSTVFDAAGSQFRPLSQSTVQRALFTTRKTVGTYNWGSGQASWSGDVKKSRRGRTIPLQAGDMSGLLINLAIMRDAKLGASLQYRFVDDSRMRMQQYAVAPATENVKVGEMNYDTFRIDRVNSGADKTTVWFTPEVPLPVRIHMKDGDDAALDLMLTQYKRV